MIGKRGEMGEIIATVAIFALLASLGVAATTKLVTKRVLYESDCDGVEIKLEKLKGNESSHEVCKISTYTTENLRFKISNTGINQIRGFSVNMVGRRGTHNVLVTEALDVGSSTELKIGYDKIRYAELADLYIIPVHTRFNVSCYESLYGTKDIGIC